MKVYTTTEALLTINCKLHTCMFTDDCSVNFGNCMIDVDSLGMGKSLHLWHNPLLWPKRLTAGL